MIITGCIVTYNNERIDIEKAIESFFNTKKNVFLYIIDNSPNDLIRNYVSGFTSVYYFHNPTNPGFGAAHNIALEYAILKKSEYHFVINPDVFYYEDIITPMIEYMDNNLDVGMMMPQILNLDGSVQHLPKLLPSPLSIFWRKIQLPAKLYSEFISKYELRFVAEGVTYNAPVLSGCFTMLNLTAIKEVGLYDDKFFMYFEDWDLSRRMHKKYKTIYFPEVSVYHGYESGANKSFRLFKIFIKSAIIYFNKWGWFFDFDRSRINKAALAKINS